MRLQRVRNPWTAATTVAEDWTFHQIAPYIGRMKTSMARALIREWTLPGQLIVDPFCGSGVVALEAAAAGRKVVAGDWNPYAVLLTRSKLFAPRNLHRALTQLHEVWDLSRSRLAQDLRTVPAWVRRFFHPETLRNALAFRDACVESNNEFLLACLLGILHHQRPGFLSYPSSHLVPYLRDRKYPRKRFPDLYKARDVFTRLEAKVRRTYKRPPEPYQELRRAYETDARTFPRVKQIDAIITSPPYMNELDYVRDNRLRLWFIDRSIPTGIELKGPNRQEQFRILIRTVCTKFSPYIQRKGHIVLVVGDATRGTGPIGRSAAITESVFAESELKSFSLERVYHDRIPDVRRSRRECKGTKGETIFVYRKNK